MTQSFGVLEVLHGRKDMEYGRNFSYGEQTRK